MTNIDEIAAAAERLAEALERRYPDIAPDVRDDAVLRALTKVAEILDAGFAVRFVAERADSRVTGSYPLVVETR